MKNKKIFIFLGIFWFLIIGGFIAFKEFTLRTGEEIVLKTVPVDPRDMFRGDYVVLVYEISSLNLGNIKGNISVLKPGDIVYVTLNTEEKYAVASDIYLSQPLTGLFIKGVIKEISGNNLNIEYGIESYFVPENKGREIERQIGRNVEVKVMVNKSGNAVVKDLLIDGEEANFN